MQLLEFDWRSALQGLAPHMAHCVKVVLDDACVKSLQQEEAFHSSGQTAITLSPVPERTTITAGSIPLHQRGDCFGTFSEREIPKKIAKVQRTEQSGGMCVWSCHWDSPSLSKIESVWRQFPVEESGDFPSYGLYVFASADLFLLLVQD